MTVYKFEEVKRQYKKSRKCGVCDKRVSRSTTICHTINPFNKNPDGTVKNYHQVYASVKEEGEKWMAEPVFCNTHGMSYHDARRGNETSEVWYKGVCYPIGEFEEAYEELRNKGLN